MPQNFKQYYFSPEDQKKFSHTKVSIRDVRSAVTAIDRVLSHGVRHSLAEESDNRIAVLLSGGVDSSLLLGMLKSSTDKEIVCITVLTSETDPDALPAWRTAKSFNATSLKCFLSAEMLPELLQPVLPSSHGGLYETAYDLALSISLQTCKRYGLTNLWTGNGLDMFFGGGLQPSQFGGLSSSRFHRNYWDYTYELLCNRFYKQDGQKLNRLVSKYDVRLHMPFETRETILAAKSIRPDIFFKHGEDKFPIRLLAHRYGVPINVSKRPKLPLQTSSGVFSLLREYMYRELPRLVDDGVNFDLTPAHFRQDPNTDVQLFLSLIAAKPLTESA